ncbi:MAG: class I SAM-dependent methyltransferase [Acidobacteriota bacterium]
MSINSEDESWAEGDAYEAFMGRWSRRLAEKFIFWLGTEPDQKWLDVGCGTGALASAISDLAQPSLVVACDPSEAFIHHAKNRITDPRAVLMIAGTGSLPDNPGGFEWVVSGLLLNFLPDPQKSIEEMREHTVSGGTVAAYVWDYAGRMEYLRCFWDEAVAMDHSAREFDEGLRFPMCELNALEQLFKAAGMNDVKSAGIEIPVFFETFSDYWQPFLGGTGPAPIYVASLDSEKRAELQYRLKNRLMVGIKGGITLVARAWAVRGTVP